MLSQYQPLFLKYRPQAISELVGQQHITVTLTNAIKYNRISHAYLFTGPRGTGKTSAARIFAKSLNCELGPIAEPCQKCTSCIEIKQGISPSVFEIDAASNNSVDDARLLIERAPLSACGGRFKLYIIDECHMLTKEAFNALLKTIEEPPANVIFILATTEEHKVLPTIVSRCQKLIFRLINEQAMLAHLESISAKENIFIEKEALSALVTRANGGLRDAVSLLDQISLLGGNGQAISTHDVLLLTGALPEDILNLMCAHIFKGEGKEVLSLLQELFASGREAHLIASELAKHMLNIVKASYGEKQSGQCHFLVDLAKLVDQNELIQMIEEVDRLEISCRRSSQPIMNLEIGLLSLCQRLDIAQWKNVESRLQKLENALRLNGGSAGIVEQNLIKQDKPINTKLSDDVPVLLSPEAKNLLDNSVNKIIKESIESVGKVEENISAGLDKLHVNVSSEEEKPTQIDFIESAGVKEIAFVKEPDKNNIDIAWQNILAELQRRHLPTFSLVSTHAFPIEITDTVLTIGVFVENFQKMIENKVEYIKGAAFACDFDKDLKVMIKVQADGQIASAGQKKNQINDSGLGTGAAFEMASVPLNMSDQGPALAKAADLRTNDEKQEQAAAKEAYRLFEGPGSRYIAPSQ